MQWSACQNFLKLTHSPAFFPANSLILIQQGWQVCLVLLQRFSVRVHRVRGTNLGCNAVCCKLHISQRLLSETRANEKRYALTFSRPRFYATSFCLSRVTAQFIMETSFVSYNFFPGYCSCRTSRPESARTLVWTRGGRLLTCANATPIV